MQSTNEPVINSKEIKEIQVVHEVGEVKSEISDINATENNNIDTPREVKEVIEVKSTEIKMKETVENSEINKSSDDTISEKPKNKFSRFKMRSLVDVPDYGMMGLDGSFQSEF